MELLTAVILYFIVFAMYMLQLILIRVSYVYFCFLVTNIAMSPLIHNI